MKKATKKIWFVLIIAIIGSFSLMTLQANAVSATKFDDIEYSSTDIPKEKLEQIIKLMYGIHDNTIKPCGIFCLFGHSIQTGTTATTEHKVFATNPRCRVTTSFIEYCTRSDCDYFVVLRQSVSIISCCP